MLILPSPQMSQSPLFLFPLLHECKNSQIFTGDIFHINEVNYAEPGLNLGLQAGEGHGPSQVAGRSQRGVSWQRTQEVAGHPILSTWHLGTPQKPHTRSPRADAEPTHEPVSPHWCLKAQVRPPPTTSHSPDQRLTGDIEIGGVEVLPWGQRHITTVLHFPVLEVAAAAR